MEREMPQKSPIERAAENLEQNIDPDTFDPKKAAKALTRYEKALLTKKHVVEVGLLDVLDTLVDVSGLVLKTAQLKDETVAEEFLKQNEKYKIARAAAEEMIKNTESNLAQSPKDTTGIAAG